MKLTIQVNEGPYQHQASDSAYFFTKAALEKGHEIFRVFFYHDGVNNGTRLTTPPQDDRNVVSRWSELAVAESSTTVKLSVTVRMQLTSRKVFESLVLAS